MIALGAGGRRSVCYAVCKVARRSSAFQRSTPHADGAYHASAAYAGRHVRDNLWLWIGVFAAITAVALWLNATAGRGGSGWGDAMAFSAMVLGILIVVKDARNHAAPDTAAAVEEAAVAGAAD